MAGLTGEVSAACRPRACSQLLREGAGGRPGRRCSWSSSRRPRRRPRCPRRAPRWPSRATPPTRRIPSRRTPRRPCGRARGRPARGAARAAWPSPRCPGRSPRAEDVDGVGCGEEPVLDGPVAALPVAAGDGLAHVGRELAHLRKIEHREDGRGRRELQDLGGSRAPLPSPSPRRERQADPDEDGRVPGHVSGGEMADEPRLPSPGERRVDAEPPEMPEDRLDGPSRPEGLLDEPADERAVVFDDGPEDAEPEALDVVLARSRRSRRMRSTTARTSGRPGSAKKASRRRIASWISPGESAAKTSRARALHVLDDGGQGLGLDEGEAELGRPPAAGSVLRRLDVGVVEDDRAGRRQPRSVTGDLRGLEGASDRARGLGARRNGTRG